GGLPACTRVKICPTIAANSAGDRELSMPERLLPEFMLYVLTFISRSDSLSCGAGGPSCAYRLAAKSSRKTGTSVLFSGESSFIAHLHVKQSRGRRRGCGSIHQKFIQRGPI